MRGSPNCSYHPLIKAWKPSWGLKGDLAGLGHPGYCANDADSPNMILKSDCLWSVLSCCVPPSMQASCGVWCCSPLRGARRLCFVSQEGRRLRKQEEACSHAQVRNDKVCWCVPFGDLHESETAASNSPFASASNPAGSPSPEFTARSALNHWKLELALYFREHIKKIKWFFYKGVTFGPVMSSRMFPNMDCGGVYLFWMSKARGHGTFVDNLAGSINGLEESFYLIKEWKQMVTWLWAFQTHPSSVCFPQPTFVENLSSHLFNENTTNNCLGSGARNWRGWLTFHEACFVEWTLCRSWQPGDDLFVLK